MSSSSYDVGSGLPSGVVEGPKFQVSHRTRFDYAEAVRENVNVLHLEPPRFPLQRTLQAFIRVLPATRLRRFEDLFGNPTHQFEIQGEHCSLEVHSTIRIQNLVLSVPASSRSAILSFYDDPEVKEMVWPFLQDSVYVAYHPEIWRKAVDLTEGLPSVYEMSLAIMRWVHDEFSYVSGSTAANTHLNEVFELRHGVCQDFTHVMLGMCRSVGVPARYASGYLYNGPSDTLVGAQASHAWAEVYFPEVGWVGFDPTNNTLADARYIKVAVGKDYDDVAPVRGNYIGTGNCRMEVRVEVSKLDL
ncbi:MAG: transglutaminase family protein [Verrucomicrobiales bacterium]